MPQEKKKTDHKAKTAAKASIRLRNSARGQSNRVLAKIADYAADKQLEKAMKLNKKTRLRGKARKKR